MFVHPETERAANLVAAAAAAAMAEVYDQIVDLFTGHGRGGVVVHLRQRAQALARSASARDQLRSSALHAAADDLAWGRSPLCQWTLFLAQENWPDEAARARVRPPDDPDAAEAEAAEAWAGEAEARLLAEAADPAEGTRRLADRLLEEVRLQAALWDDPRLSASPATRRLMKAGEAALRRRVRDCAPIGERHAVAPRQARGSWLGRLRRALEVKA